jgi:hypothetical protein
MSLSKLSRTTPGRTLACALIASSIAAPAASAMPQDFRSPDARDAATRPEQRHAPRVDQSRNTVAPASASDVEGSGSSGFDWSTAGISVAALSGLVLVSIAVLTGVRHGDRRMP